MEKQKIEKKGGERNVHDTALYTLNTEVPGLLELGTILYLSALDLTIAGER